MKPRKPKREDYKDITEIRFSIYDPIVVTDLQKMVDDYVNAHNYHHYETVEPFVPVTINVNQEWDYGCHDPYTKIELVAKGKWVFSDASFKKIEEEYEKQLVEYEEQQKKQKEVWKNQELAELKRLQKKYGTKN